MARVTADISVSMDGFVTGPDDSRLLPMGVDGHRLHQWIYDLATWRARVGLDGGRANRDAEILDEGFASVGAHVIGRRMYDHGEKPWGDEPPFGLPVFVVTHEPRPVLELAGGTRFEFVPEGVESAVSRALAAAGGRDVSVLGGASVIRQCLRAGLLDELVLHVVPVLMGDGVRLFDRTRDGQVELPISRVEQPDQVVHLWLAPRAVSAGR
ncbi:dihydrofolate reductase family protein [Micromonospora foliorum]|uniref:dihydrofolate reductase family protein n=1 Tax=Micromonospora foliorum TaxID=2911210 RepID=UPI001EE7E368|nr:dihydrofolate reductase family protein [Micromonospora foliorum]MCG5439009.1 dihydrofolate reductase family protein [Micromonospora foliorum]